MPDLVFDPEGIHRAVLNVVTNAIDAVAEKQPPGQVDVRTEYDAAEPLARIVVEDNGPGIPADQMDHLFSPFVSSKKSRGTGLGLPVSQKIIREHGGKLLVESQVGRGARFTFELPAVLPKNEDCPRRNRRRSRAKSWSGKRKSELGRTVLSWCTNKWYDCTIFWCSDFVSLRIGNSIEKNQSHAIPPYPRSFWCSSSWRRRWRCSGRGDYGSRDFVLGLRHCAFNKAETTTDGLFRISSF